MVADGCVPKTHAQVILTLGLTWPRATTHTVETSSWWWYGTMVPYQYVPTVPSVWYHTSYHMVPYSTIVAENQHPISNKNYDTCQFFTI